MEMETKEDGSILLDEKSQKMVDVQPLKITDDMINGVIKGQEHEMNKLSAFSDHGDEINIADGNETESDATAKFPHSIDVDFESLQPVFVNPDEGTPAAEALAANAALVVSKVTKGLHRLRVRRLTMKRLNIVKQLKKTSKGRQFSKNFKGKVIDGLHELYTLTAGMMLGIRCSVGRTTLDSRDELVLEDFSHVEKMSFPPSGNTKPGFITPPHPLAHTFKFKSYSLQVFRRIRTFFGIDNAEYMMSVCGNYNFLEFISNSKSGQFFFYSHDGKYMIKTQTKEENKFMKRVLPHYYKFVTENPHTLLVRILGMHRVKMYHLRRKVHFVIMTSVFDTPEKIHTVYDLKGSLIGRQATEKERTHGGVLKDMDLVIDKTKLLLGSKKDAFMIQIEKDAMFLAKLNIMDYSLLVGIHSRKQRAVPATATPGEVEIAGPVGQHSNTPFRRNRSATLIKLANDKSVSPPPTSPASFSPTVTNSRKSLPVLQKLNQQQSSSNAMSVSSVSGLKYKEIGKSQDREEGDMDFGCVVESDQPSLAVLRRNSSTRSPSKKEAGGGVKKYDDEHDDSMEFKRASRRLSRAKSISSNCSFDPVALSPHRDRKGGGGLGLGIGGEISRPTSTLRKKSPGRRKSKAEGDLLNVLAGGQKSGPFSPNDDDYDDDDDYSMDEDDIELDIDFARLGSKEELDTEDEDHYDDGDSDVGTSYHHNKNDSNSMLMISNQHQQYQESIILPEDNKSLIAPYKRRECEDEGEGLKGIEGSKLAPMLRVRASIGGMIGIGSKSSSKNNSNSNSNNNSYTDMKSGNKNKPSSSSSMFLGIRTKSPSLDPSPEVYSCCDAYEVGGGRSGLESAITFGPGASQQHPWTLRKDSGVNSRLLNGQRGDEIYYMGVIDILQQYNMRKRAETLIKSISNDSKQISSVDSTTYAKRFIEFINENIV